MFAKIYFYLWLAILAIAGIFYQTGNMTDLTASVFWMIAFGMVFLGMMNVLPWTLEHKTAEPLPVKKEKSVEPATLAVPSGARTVRI